MESSPYLGRSAAAGDAGQDPGSTAAPVSIGWSSNWFARSTEGQNWGNLRIHMCLEKSHFSIVKGERKKVGRKGTLAAARALCCVTKPDLLEFTAVARSHKWHLSAAVPADVSLGRTSSPARISVLELS